MGWDRMNWEKGIKRIKDALLGRIGLEPEQGFGTVT